MSVAASAAAAAVGAGAVALFRLNRLPSSPSTSYRSCLLLKGLRAFAPFPYRYHFASYSTSSLLSQEAAAVASQLPRSHANTSSNVVEILEQRGLLESLTSDGLRSVCSSSAPNQPPLRVYCGFDPTADSLHLGNLLGIIVLSWFLRCGHRAVALIGGATGRVGDPSGKSSERPELDLETLHKNISGISATIRHILSRAAPTPDSVSILNNYEWWKDVRLLDFLKDVGRYARVGTMMSKESVRKRLESDQGMSYTEFTYQILQGYDFVHLFRQEGVSVQIGGSDQWGNITAGTDLIRRILRVEGAAYGLTFPLLLKSDGTKFGKSEDGAIWLSPSKFTPYNFYQYFFSVPDDDVVRFLKMLTFLSLEEIAQLERDMDTPGYVPNTAQRRLAEEVTRFVHGQEGLDEALKATEALRPGAATKLDAKTIEGIREDVPSCSLPYDQVLSLSLLDLSVSSGLLESKSAARRLLKQGGLYLNNSRVDSEAKKIEANDIIDGKVILLSAGKKNKMVVRVS
ncbi:tyrosine--tRNA ligase, chloroplastic/mitochondrial-like isoform X2 [Coffea eugenioides]|uniref:Tyrosine--tRNA ligase n=2 Tax=Coffea TaxID=13442 RepID=A0A6P6WRH2_COFAR|nr:tyrosine--tRNA ligase, chloroplastic/mitochondrial-like isoform X2 [Coffea arabica]XP_027118034.1 tyrosine--tRNA ligase, chloroplastic/mitochondrial-like isoform X2 [Coffea arabica]XP_027118035.1 tyrosine--tRNA ligase, chloroplastic/mitochondrial-like isoform X2 [Coffea arabica]XP_027118036.1 tyrosine--tRNA ligase, chloroplastic/mitochondrial-like isoform X2 [Coffea arabica]XP_027167127.1 tyrosine--tRNA ligase, chloroplastic/mitochondrial-like isoform X2 [Coffea eugenioides]XP_027167128.1 t